MAIDFDSVISMEDESIKVVFNKIEESRLKKFFNFSSHAIYSYELMCIYDNRKISEDRKVIMSVHDHSLVVDEEFFANIFQFPNERISSFSKVSSINIEEMHIFFIYFWEIRLGIVP